MVISMPGIVARIFAEISSPPSTAMNNFLANLAAAKLFGGTALYICGSYLRQAKKDSQVFFLPSRRE
jgi:hypothetical protein